MRRAFTSFGMLLATAGLLGFTFIQPAHAQVLYGSIVGTVTDPSGAALPGAQVMATSVQTGLKRRAATNSAGQYRILDLPQATYNLDVTATGFQPMRRTGVAVVIGQVNQQDLQMSVGAVTQQVTVQASAVVLQTQKADVHTTISSRAISNLPMDVYNNVQTLELLAPGVVSLSAIQNNYPNSLADTPDRSLAINANGLPQHINTTRVDGATNIFLWLPDHMVVVPPAQTVQEVNVQTSNYDVEKGLTAGAATDVVTKSGGNEFHGSVYGFHTDQGIDARNFFAPRQTENIQNNDGFTLGGPIKRDKLFFFGNWDGFFQHQGRSTLNVIPPGNFRNGDFSSALGAPLFDSNGNPLSVCTTEGATTQLRQGMVFDPTTGKAATGTGRCVFSSGGQINVIPAARMNAGTAAYWNLLRAPNLPGAFTPTTAANDFVSTVSAWHRYIYTTRVDYNLSDRQTVWVKYTAQDSHLNDPPDYGSAGEGGGTGLTQQLAQTATLGHTWTAKPDLVLTGHVGFTRMGEKNTQNGFGQPLGRSVLGIPGTNEPLGDKRYSGMPGISIEGFTSLGDSNSWEPLFRNDWTLTLDENATLIHGNHEFRFGLDAAHNHLNHWQPEIVCCPAGFLNFTQDNTFLNLPASAANPTGPQMKVYTNQGGALAPVGFNSDRQNSVAEFDLGLVNSVQKSEQFIKDTAKDWQTALYFGDRWRVTPKLTADLGLRWEYYPMITRDGVSKFELYNPTTNVLSLGGVGGNATHLGVTSSKKLLAPRVGFAYRWNDKTVVRSAFGITYDTLPLERPLRGFYPLAIGASNFVPQSKVSRFLPYASFQQGVPLIQPPDISSGNLTPPPNVLVISMAPGHFNRGYVEEWNFTVERRLPAQVFFTLAYVGNHFVHEFNARNINAAPLGAGGAGQPLSQFKRFVATFQDQGYLDSHYHSLQASIFRSMANGLFLQGSYTLSHAISYEDDEAASSSNTGLLFNCPPSAALPQGCQPLNRGTPGFDHTHIFKMAFIYELPLGAGKPWANGTRAARAVLGGWQTNGVFTALTGAPLTVTQTSSFLNTPGTSQVPDFVGPLRTTQGIGPGQFWFNPGAFEPVQTTRIGTAGRGVSWLRGPGLAQLDFSVFRHFKFKERYDFELRLQALNLTNTPHFFNPSTSCSIVNGACGGSLGQITSAFGQRILQIGGMLTF